MRNICHIRCNDKYWEELNIYSRYTRIKKQYNYYKKIIELWDINLKIKYLTFRKQIRDIIINHISNTNCFDIILESNQHCTQYFANNTDNNLIFYQQDDDDIFLELPELHDLQPGVNIFQYSFIDPIGGRRKKGYKKRNFDINGHMTRVQSNHCIVYNTKNEIDINKHSLYNADHTYYDKLIENNNYYINNKYPISIQLYHLHSISVWKHQFKFSNCDYTEEEMFLPFVSSYIKEIDDLYVENKTVPLLKDINNMYKQLL